MPVVIVVSLLFCFAICFSNDDTDVGWNLPSLLFAIAAVIFLSSMIVFLLNGN